MYSTPYSSLYSASVISSLVASTFSEMSFNDYDLQNGSVNIVEIDIESPGTIQYTAKDRGLDDGATFIDRKHRSRQIAVKGYLIAATRQAVEELADEFKKNIDTVQGVLRMKTRGENWRQIVATATIVSMPRAAYHVTKIHFTVTFTANSPFFEAVTSESDTFEAITTAAYIDSIQNDGTGNMGAKAYILFGTGNAGVGSISINTNNRTLTITDTFSDNDVILVDFEGKKVLVNGVKHEYSGTFPDFIPGVNNFVCTVDGTHLYDLIFIKKFKYL